MTRASALPLWSQRLLLPALALVAIYLPLIPLAPGSGAVPPDLLFCLLVGWTIRRPNAIPAWAVLLLGLFADLMLSRPVGLGALGLLLATEAARIESARLRSGPFLLEWLLVTLCFALVLTWTEILLRLSFAAGPGFGAALRHLGATALAYPLVVAGLVWLLGLRAPRETRQPGRLP
ncbi:MAG: rod shape-determining protein MreD [Amaricoccus sp.]